MLWKWGSAASGHYGNVALQTTLLAELFFNLAVKWGMVVCSGAYVSSAYYMTEWTDPQHVRNVKKSKAYWVRAGHDTN